MLQQYGILPEAARAAGVDRAMYGGKAQNFAYILDRALDRYPDREAVVDGQRRYTYKRLLERSNGVANFLKRSGIGRGDRVGVILHNCAEFLEIFFGTIRLGAIIVPINFRLSGPEFIYILEHSGVKVLFTERDLAEKINQATDKPQWQTVIVGQEGEYEQATSDEQWVECEPVDLFELQRIMYTSGTTGYPKGVMIHHGAVLWKCLNQHVEFGLTPDDIFLASGPLYHVGTLDLPGVGLLTLGGKIVILPKFDVPTVLRTIEEERVTCAFLAPSMINMLLADPNFDQYDVSSLRIIIDGSEKMPISILQKMPQAFPNAKFYDGFGMTETITGDCFLAPHRLQEKLGSVGKPTLGMELRVVDDDGNDVPPNTPGELVVRGPKLCLGYWRDPEATREAFRDGWFHTGDVAQIDEDGYIYIVDRKKDMIISGGENIASVEVERVLYAHPSVLESAVVGRPDPKWGEVPVAFVVPRPGHKLDANELTQYCRQHLAGFKVPKAFITLDSLPRNPSGKVLKRELRRMVQAGEFYQEPSDSIGPGEPHGNS